MFGLECGYCLDEECENVGGPWPCTSDDEALDELAERLEALKKR